MANSWTCAECGAQMPFDDSFRLTITSPTHDLLEAAFCRQDHASSWLAKPIPAAMPDVPLTPGEKAGCFVVSAVILALAVAGFLAVAFGTDVNPF